MLPLDDGFKTSFSLYIRSKMERVSYPSCWSREASARELGELVSRRCPRRAPARASVSELPIAQAPAYALQEHMPQSEGHQPRQGTALRARGLESKPERAEIY